MIVRRLRRVICRAIHGDRTAGSRLSIRPLFQARFSNITGDQTTTIGARCRPTRHELTDIKALP